MSNQIICGDVTLTDEHLLSGYCVMNHARNGESLAYDTLGFEVHFDPSKFSPIMGQFIESDDKNFIDSDSKNFMVVEERVFLEEFATGNVATYKFGETTIGKFYVEKVEQIGKMKYRVSMTSAVGVLENSMHYGGIYEGTVLEDILDEIFSGIDYDIDPAIANLKIYGWLPYDTKRNNLQQLTMATNMAIKIDSTGGVYITALSSAVMAEIDKTRIQLGGSVKNQTPCVGVRVTEHTFTESTEVITLCESAFNTEEIIIFPEPCHDLSVTNGTIISSGANYAIIDGNGSVTLTGKKYYHTQKEITYGTVTGTDKVVTVSNGTLINSLNSSTVAQRIYDVYSLPQTIEQDISLGEERCGDVVDIVNPYTEESDTSFLQKLEISFGSFLKAKASLLKGFLPSGASSGYENKVILTSSQTWTVPEGVTEIRAVLIGGGQGGAGGNSGEAGENGPRGPRITSEPASGFSLQTQYENGTGGDGGTGGLGGAGGKINDLGPIVVTPSENISAVIGSGGSGGASDTEGSAGGNTTFGVYTSADGQSRVQGYTDIMTGNAYALTGGSGYAGGNGLGGDNWPPSPTFDGNTSYIWSGETYTLSGWYGSTYWYWIDYGGGNKIWLYGGGGSGGGPAYYKTGGNGTNGSATYNNGNGFAEGGNGGAGATPSYTGTNATTYGNGGNGGHGGGGGGGGGCYNNPNGDMYDWPGFGGSGGAGSSGGDGADGCIIIYY